MCPLKPSLIRCVYHKTHIFKTLKKNHFGSLYHQALNVRVICTGNYVDFTGSVKQWIGDLIP